MVPKLKISFLLPVNTQAGGVFVVYLQARVLAERGHDVTIVFSRFDKNLGFSSFGSVTLKHMVIDEIPDGTIFDIVIATWWETFYELPKVQAKKYFYFIQSDERRFYPIQDSITRRWVETTYSFPEIATITEAKWIKHFLVNEFNLSTAYAPNGIDNSIFHDKVLPLQEKDDLIRVLIEGPGSVDFKRLDDAFRITNHFADIEVWCVCSDGQPKPHWRIDRLFNTVKFTEMPSIYRSCDILIKISAVEGFFGPPLEMMATGGACIVSDVTGYDEYVVDEENALVIPIGDINAGINALKRLKSDPILRKKLGENGKLTAKRMDWSFQTPHFESGLLDLYSKVDDLSPEKKKLILNLGELRILTSIEIRDRREQLNQYRYKVLDKCIHIFKTRLPRVFNFLRKVAIYFINRVIKLKQEEVNRLQKPSKPTKLTVLAESISPRGNFTLSNGPILFVGQPEYFRSVYRDALGVNGNEELCISSADFSNINTIPDLVRFKKFTSVIIFRPEWLCETPEVFFAIKKLGCQIIGYSTEPVPLDNQSNPHIDQINRLNSLMRVKKLPFDAIIHFDHASRRTLQQAGINNLLFHPLCVSRELFHPENTEPDFDICFLGRSTDHREKYLGPLKARYGVIHVAHGLHDADARSLMNRSKVVLNIHNHQYLNFENRIVQALYCGRKVLSEPLSNSILKPEIDFIEFQNTHQLVTQLDEIMSSGSWKIPFENDHNYPQFEISSFLSKLRSPDAGSFY